MLRRFLISFWPHSRSNALSSRRPPTRAAWTWALQLSETKKGVGSDDRSNQGETVPAHPIEVSRGRNLTLWEHPGRLSQSRSFFFFFFFWPKSSSQVIPSRSGMQSRIAVRKLCVVGKTQRNECVWRKGPRENGLVENYEGFFTSSHVDISLCPLYSRKIQSFLRNTRLKEEDRG